MLSEYFNKWVGVILSEWGFIYLREWFNVYPFVGVIATISCFMLRRWNVIHPQQQGALWNIDRTALLRRHHRFECWAIECEPTTSCQSPNTSPHPELLLHYGRNTAAKRAGQRATGSSSRANLPTCGEDHSGVPGRSRPLQKRGYPAEKAAGTAVRFESRSNINQNRCVTKVVF